MLKWYPEVRLAPEVSERVADMLREGSHAALQSTTHP